MDGDGDPESAREKILKVVIKCTALKVAHLSIFRVQPIIIREFTSIKFTLLVGIMWTDWTMEISLKVYSYVITMVDGQDRFWTYFARLHYRLRT